MFYVITLNILLLYASFLIKSILSHNISKRVNTFKKLKIAFEKSKIH